MRRTRAIRRSIGLLTVLIAISVALLNSADLYRKHSSPQPQIPSQQATGEAMTVLESLSVKGRAPKTGYERDLFGSGWQSDGDCDTRNLILRRDLSDTIINSRCQVVTGSLDDPYTGKTIRFQRGETSSQAVQIDHVVALSDAWQKGAQQLTAVERKMLANDPLELLAVDGEANQQKGDGDAATWLPPNRSFRCQYVARQIAVKKTYTLWVTQPEKDAMLRVLGTCPDQRLPAGYSIR